jgi:hypothetical protein
MESGEEGRKDFQNPIAFAFFHEKFGKGMPKRTGSWFENCTQIHGSFPFDTLDSS